MGEICRVGVRPPSGAGGLRVRAKSARMSKDNMCESGRFGANGNEQMREWAIHSF